MHSTKARQLKQGVSAPLHALFIAPHLDDAVLSCGNVLSEFAATGKTVAVVTLFTNGNDQANGADIARFLDRCGHATSSGLFASRRHEDHHALDTYGYVYYDHAGFTDALFRTENTGTGGVRNLYPSFTDLFSGRISPKDRALFRSIVRFIQLLKERYTTTRTQVFAPVGIGNHADHLLTHDAARIVFEKRAQYWEDIPYRSDSRLLFQRISYLEQNGITVSRRPYLTMRSDMKRRAVDCYQSQLAGLYSAGLGTIDYCHEALYERTH